MLKPKTLNVVLISLSVIVIIFLGIFIFVFVSGDNTSAKSVKQRTNPSQSAQESKNYSSGWVITSGQEGYSSGVSEESIDYNGAKEMAEQGIKAIFTAENYNEIVKADKTDYSAMDKFFDDILLKYYTPKAIDDFAASTKILEMAQSSFDYKRPFVIVSLELVRSGSGITFNFSIQMKVSINESYKSDDDEISIMDSETNIKGQVTLIKTETGYRIDKFYTKDFDSIINTIKKAY